MIVAIPYVDFMENDNFFRLLVQNSKLYPATSFIKQQLNKKAVDKRRDDGYNRFIILFISKY